MDEAITQAHYFYTAGIAAGILLGVVGTILYAALYSLRS